MRVSQIGSTSQNIPGTYPREQPVCGRCPRCHPGKNWGGDEACRALPDARPWVRDCACHRTDHADGGRAISACRICKHDETAHTRRMTRKRYGFITKRACTDAQHHRPEEEPAWSRSN